MKKLLIVILLLSIQIMTLAQDLNHEKQLMLAKEFMRMVFDMQSFDSISKLTTLNKDLPLARFKYSSAYFSLIILRLQIVKNKCSYPDLSYIPYLLLQQDKRTLVYEKLIDGVPNGIDLSMIYAVYDKNGPVTYIAFKNGKISGIKSYYSQGGADYIHQFNMEEVDNKSSLAKLDSVKPMNIEFIRTERNKLSIAWDFINFTRDSLNETSQKKAVVNFFKFRQKLLTVDTLDVFTIYYLTENLKEKLNRTQLKELLVIPYKELSKKQKKGLDLKQEYLNGIFAVMDKKSIVTYLYVTRNKIKYFVAFKNLKGKYVFVPFGYFTDLDT